MPILFSKWSGFFVMGLMSLALATAGVRGQNRAVRDHGVAKQHRAKDVKPPPVPEFRAVAKPLTVVDRWFVITLDGRLVGKAHFTVDRFTDTKAVRNGWEYFAFRDTQSPQAHRFWARYYNSVDFAGRPGSEWVTGWWNGKGFSYRLKSGRGSATFRANRLGETVSERAVNVHGGHRLAHHVYAALGDRFAARGGDFTYRYLNWRAPVTAIDRTEERVFPKVTLQFEKREEISLPDRKKIQAAKFRRVCDGDRARASYLWVDEDGWPLRKSIPFARKLELTLIAAEKAKALKVMSWEEAKKQFGSDTGLLFKVLDGNP